MNEVPPLDVNELHDHPLFRPRNENFDFDAYLYHYTRWETILELIHSNSLDMSSIDRMNDPRESKDWIVGTSHRGAPDLTGIDIQEMLREVSRYKQHLKLLSFSQDVSRDTPMHPYLGAGFARPTMWAHYAGGHTGCCIVFDKKRLVQRFMAESSHLFGTPSGVIHKAVTYSADAFAGDSSLQGISADYLRVNAVAAVRDHFKRINDTVWFQKHSDWSSEAEYRLVYHDAIEGIDPC